MAEENPGGQGGRTAKLLRRLGVIAAIVMVAAIAALLIYGRVIAPMFAEDADQSSANERIPSTAVSLEFEQSTTHMIMPEPDMPASYLAFKVTLVCANPRTAALIEKQRPLFRSTINNCHSFLHRDDCDDRALQESVQKQILQKANELLRELQERPDPEIRVIRVVHEDWMVSDI
ncbi:MAG TPA: hypothetical protein HPP77_10100 [Candidatus Hydrogenedentes bacterium]|nr:hypothetical protein [Candidatus Hydrogenedentota bacterium]